MKLIKNNINVDDTSSLKLNGKCVPFFDSNQVDNSAKRKKSCVMLMEFIDDSICDMCAIDR